MDQAPRPTDNTPQLADQTPDGEDRREARRQFLARCGRFAVITPPAMTMLLAVSSIPREAHAVSGNNFQGDEEEERQNRTTILNALRGLIPQNLFDFIARLLA
jgi:hypothetical protein